MYTMVSAISSGVPYGRRARLNLGWKTHSAV
jgi:hypothetical protein